LVALGFVIGARVTLALGAFVLRLSTAVSLGVLFFAALGLVAVRVALGLRWLGLLGAFVLGLLAAVRVGFLFAAALGLVAVALGLRFLAAGLLVPAAGLRLAGLADAGDHLADRKGVALLGHDLDEDAVGIGVVGHVGLVRLDLHERLSALDLGTLLDQPLEDGALLHGVRQAGHRDVVGHAPPYRSRKVASAACTTCSSCGNAACSSGFE
jgi:hypothetical protein